MEQNTFYSCIYIPCEHSHGQVGLSVQLTRSCSSCTRIPAQFLSPKTATCAGVILFFNDLMRAPRNMAEAAGAAVRAVAATASSQSLGTGVAGFTATSGTGR